MERMAGLIDVFAETPLAGNPLAVVEDADGFDDATLKAIAREFNQAETTFLMTSQKADRRLRSFTAAGAEVFGAGHNALGAWLWLAERGTLGDLATPKTFHQEIGKDVLAVIVERRNGRFHARMRQAPLRLMSPSRDSEALAGALGLVPEDLSAGPPPRAADTGAAHLMLRLRDRSAVDRASPDAQKLLPLLKRAGAEGCYVYAFEPPAFAYARFFNPAMGLWEDAATGTAAGPLAGYLAHEGLLEGTRLEVEQGTLMGRRSIIEIALMPEPELSGSGVIVMRGMLRV